MTAIDYFKKVLSQYADYRGRARRSEYWYFVLINFAIYLGLLSLVFISTIFIVLPFLWSFAMLVPTFCVCIRRLHDSGKSGAHIFLAFVPLIGGIIMLAFLIMDSEPGENQWGPNPKEAYLYADKKEYLV